MGILRIQAGLDYSRYGRLSHIVDLIDEKSNGAFFNTSFVSIELTKDVETAMNGSAPYLTRSKLVEE